MAVSVVKPDGWRAPPSVGASAASPLAAMAPVPATTKAPTPSQIFRFDVTDAPWNRSSLHDQSNGDFAAHLLAAIHYTAVGIKPRQTACKS
jgi:hypothetical protein